MDIIDSSNTDEIQKKIIKLKLLNRDLNDKRLQETILILEEYILKKANTVNAANTTNAVNAANTTNAVNEATNVANASTMYKFSNSLGQRDKMII